MNSFWVIQSYTHVRQEKSNADNVGINIFVNKTVKKRLDPNVTTSSRMSGGAKGLY